jgi:hypothetical protein
LLLEALAVGRAAEQSLTLAQRRLDLDVAR